MIFVKYPEPGKVKTRIADVLGDEEAAQIYRKLVARVSDQVVPGEDEGFDWTVWILFDPPESELAVRDWLQPHFDGVVERFLPQVRGDLGDRLAGAFRAGFAAGFDRVAAIGTDCVDLDRKGVAECWDRLEEADLVFGPANDGGYYLVAMKQEWGALFEGVPWSCSETLAASREIAVRLGLSVSELVRLDDIDEPAQWEALCARERIG